MNGEIVNVTQNYFNEIRVYVILMPKDIRACVNFQPASKKPLQFMVSRVLQRYNYVADESINASSQCLYTQPLTLMTS